MSILIVDDEADGREVVAQYMSKAGHAVRTAPSGRAALIALAANVPEVVILDLMMPKMNGLEFMRVIRGYLRWSTLPVIVLTAYPDDHQITHMREMGVNCIFTKSSYQLSDLLACVNAVRSDPTARCGDC